jgi:UDP-2,3-diacylglucosamine pyrophosphatase LpxH
MQQVKSVVVLSDIHLGRPSSYLYSKNAAYEQNRRVFTTLLRSLGPQDELVLNGDVLELSLAGWDEIERETSLFFDLISEAGGYKRVVYIPGNHDHHFWRLLVEKIYLLDKLARGKTLPDLDEYPYCFVDQRFSSKDHDVILNKVWPAGKPVPEFIVKYPHHLLRVEGRATEDRTYLITHGHFLEDLFRPMNILIEPARLDELEAFNNIWLEAFHYHLGQAGRLSNRVREIIGSYERGGKPAQRTLKKVFDELYARLNRRVHIVWPFNWLIRHAIKKIVRKVSLTRHSELFGVPVNENLKKNIKSYIEKYLVSRYKNVMKRDYHFPGDPDIPLPFTFVFGHTHRPVTGEDIKDTAVRINDLTFPLVNSGGWLRSDSTGRPRGTNAGILLLNKAGWTWHTLAGQIE